MDVLVIADLASCTFGVKFQNWEKNVVPRRPDLFPLFSFVPMITRWLVKGIGVSHAKPPLQTRSIFY